jgi:hypothetical protein
LVLLFSKYQCEAFDDGAGLVAHATRRREDQRVEVGMFHVSNPLTIFATLSSLLSLEQVVEVVGFGLVTACKRRKRCYIKEGSSQPGPKPTYSKIAACFFVLVR